MIAKSKCTMPERRELIANGSRQLREAAVFHQLMFYFDWVPFVTLWPVSSRLTIAKPTENEVESYDVEQAIRISLAAAVVASRGAKLIWVRIYLTDQLKGA